MERIRKSLKYIVPTSLLVLAITCPWALNAMRIARHNILVQNFVNQGCVVSSIINDSTNPITGKVYSTDEISGETRVEQDNGSRSIASSTHTSLKCPPGLSSKGNPNFTVFSYCSAMLDPATIIRQIQLTPTEPGRIIGCGQDFVNN